jgi:RNA-directed DNA polymerase
VVLVDEYERHDWIVKAVNKRLREEFAKLQVQVNEEKTRQVDLRRDECFGFLGFEFRRIKSLKGMLRPQYTPLLRKRTELLRNLKEEFHRLRSQLL